MEFNRRFFLILFGAILLGGGFGYFYFESRSPGPGNREEIIDSDQAITDFSLTENRKKNEIWRLYSKKARKNGGVVNLSAPRVVYTVSGETRAVVTAETGKYELDNRLLTLRKNVKLVRPQLNQVLLTSVLSWDRTSGMLKTDEKVTLSMPQGTLRGVGMRAQLRKEILRFLSDVKFSQE
ncbi:MAG: LPS export ABC transporter periplasmic protein LptC [bacterium]